MKEVRYPQPRRVLPIVSVITFLGFLDTHLLIPVMALYASGLGASVGIIGLIIGLYSITNTPANVLFGRLVDRVGYRLPLTIGLIGDALSMFRYSVSRLPVHLPLVRALHGASGGLVGPATMSLTARHSERAGKGRAMGIYGMALAAATLVGYGLSGFIVSRLGYQPLFLLGAALLVAGVLASLLLPKDRGQDTTANKTLPGGGSARVKELLKRPGLSLAYCSIFAQYFTFGGVVTLLPLYVRGLGMEAFHIGMLLAIFAIMFIIVQLPGGALSDRIGRRIPATTGLSLAIAALIMLPQAGTFLPLAIAMALYGLAYGMLFPSVSALVADNAAPEERGVATGIFHALLTAGVAIGAPVMGWVGEAVGAPLSLTLTPAIMVFPLALALASLRRRPV